MVWEKWYWNEDEWYGNEGGNDREMRDGVIHGMLVNTRKLRVPWNTLNKSSLLISTVERYCGRKRNTIGGG